MRVRDVEIALVLAREMKDAAARDVDASLRLEQLREVFGADELDAGERARIQTALQMAGLEPRPSLLEAGADEPIRFEVSADEAAAAAAPAPPPAEERQEFPTVGQFTRSTFRRFRERRKRKGEAEEQVTTATELPPATEPVEPVEPEPEPEPLAYEEPEPVLPEEEDDPELEPTNGHVDVATNGNGHHIDLLDDVALPPHDTATPADFGASAETIDFDDPRLGEEWAEHPLDEEEDADAEAEAEEPALVYPEEEPEYEPEPVPLPEPDPEPVVQPHGARVGEAAAVLLPLAAIPVLVASLAGWTFGLPFVALSLIATGVLVGRRGGFFKTLRESDAARTVAKATAAVTFASLGISIVLANVHTGGGTKSGKTTSKPAAKTPTAPAQTPTTPAPQASKPKKKHRHHANPTTSTTPATPAPDPSTKGLIRVPPSSSTTSTTPQSPTSTTPAATPGQPVPQGQTP